MIINKTNIDAIFVNLKTIFNKAFGEAKTTWGKIAMRVPSTSKQNDYSWLSNFPKMRKWIGEKALSALAAFKYSIANDDFEVTVVVDRNDIEDDELGIYEPMAKGAGVAARELPDELIYEVVNGGFANECYDGQYFWDTDHPVGKGADKTSVSNKTTNVLNFSSLVNAKASFGAARIAMRKFKDDEGRSLNVNPNILLVGPALEDEATIGMKAKELADGSPNPYLNACEVVMDTRITSDTFWALLDTTKPVKPFIYQERKKPVFVKQVSMENDAVFMSKKLKFGAEARAKAGYGPWQLAYASDGSGS